MKTPRPDPHGPQHSHDFLPDQSVAERSTRWVMLLTALMMVAEIAVGISSGSMALLADGWHMATHVAAFGIAVFAYRYARTHAQDPRFTFGPGKVTDLGGFASALTLGFVALAMIWESSLRLLEPQSIALEEALWVATLGLAVNLVSALLLQRRGHDHDHDHDHGHDHPHEHDTNLRAAYVHVLADALTSVLAIAALLAGKYLGWLWMDAAMGLVGAAVILRWAYGLVRRSAAVLLDGTDHRALERQIRDHLDLGADEAVTDLHIWNVAPGRAAATMSLVTHEPRTPDEYRARLADLRQLVHVVIEVNRCQEAHDR